MRGGHDVTVLCGESSIDGPREEWINDVHVFRWPVWAPGDAYHIPRMRGKLRDEGFTITAISQLLNGIERGSWHSSEGLAKLSFHLV